MAKAKTKADEAPKARKKSAKPASTTAKIKKAARKVQKKGAKLASNPAVAEVVAATLVAAAAALRDPKKARLIAETAADEIKTAGKQVAASRGPLWQIALDVARRSLEAVQRRCAGQEGQERSQEKEEIAGAVRSSNRRLSTDCWCVT